jgi:hypothetical protein
MARTDAALSATKPADDGLIGMHYGHRGCTDDATGPGKTVYVVMSLIATETGR